jgi:hypothetical protein
MTPSADPPRALEDCLRVRPGDPRYRAACVRAVDLVPAQGRVSLEFENFIASFIRSGPLAAEERDAFYRLAHFYLDQGFPENAAEALAKLIAVDPGYRDAPQLLASVGGKTTDLPGLPEAPPVPAALGPDRARERGEAEFEAPLFDVGVTIANRYRLDQRIGSGGMSVVFRAHDVLVGEDLALKVLTHVVHDEEADRRFKRELALSRQISHPNVIRLYDIGFFHGFRYITMELLSGLDLRARMRHPLPMYEALDYLVQACAGLQAAHDRGVIHRDVKPENCFITRTRTLKLMDFGIAKVQDAPGLTSTGIIAGTAAYMAPEQGMSFRGVTPSADIYALGVVAYELVTGSLPFNHPETMPLLLMHANDPPPPPRRWNPALPEELERVILKCLEKDPARRFASCRELGERLDEIRRR